MGGRLRDSSTAKLYTTDVHESVEERTRSEHNSLAVECNAKLSCNSLYFTIFYNKTIDRVLPNPEVWSVLERRAPLRYKPDAVGLGARTPHCRTLAAIEHPELDGSAVGNNSHLTAKRIYFSDNLTLSNTANGRIATHLGYLIHIDSD